jgi:hypothetical protein
LPEIILAKCFIDPPFAWHGVVETSAYDLLRNSSDTDEAPEEWLDLNL